MNFVKASLSTLLENLDTNKYLYRVASTTLSWWSLLMLPVKNFPWLFLLVLGLISLSFFSFSPTLFFLPLCFTSWNTSSPIQLSCSTTIADDRVSILDLLGRLLFLAIVTFDLVRLCYCCTVCFVWERKQTTQYNYCSRHRLVYLIYARGIQFHLFSSMVWL